MAKIFKLLQNGVLLAQNRTHILQKSISSPVQTSVDYYSRSSKVHQNLGIPAPPKQPPSAYVRFFKDTFKQVSGTKASDKAKSIAQLWKQIEADRKQSYTQAAEKDHALYVKQLEVYKRNLSEDQILAMKNERKRLKYESVSKAERKQRKTQLDALGKPKKPTTAYLLFRAEHNTPGASVASIAAKWKNLSESEKAKYINQANGLREKYLPEIQNWEKQMIAQGNQHLVRKTALVKKPKDDKKLKKE